MCRYRLDSVLVNQTHSSALQVSNSTYSFSVSHAAARTKRQYVPDRAKPRCHPAYHYREGNAGGRRGQQIDGRTLWVSPVITTCIREFRAAPSPLATSKLAAAIRATW